MGLVRSFRRDVKNRIKAFFKNAIFLFYKKKDDIFEFPLVTMEDRVVHSNLGDNFVIPPVVYQTWVNREFGQSHARELEKFRFINKDLSFYIFDNNRLNNYMKINWGNHEIYNVFNNSKFGAMKADIFRYCILYERGGYYFDINKGCNVSLRSLHMETDTALLAFESNVTLVPPSINYIKNITLFNRLVLQWGLGFAEKHPLLNIVINNICMYYQYFRGRKFDVPGDAILMFTGPGMLTKSLIEFFDLKMGLQCSFSGIDFNHHGYVMKGTHIRFRASPSYMNSRNSIIVS